MLRFVTETFAGAKEVLEDESFDIAAVVIAVSVEVFLVAELDAAALDVVVVLLECKENEVVPAPRNVLGVGIAPLSAFAN
ncbi:unnamed protein product [Gongylonema pulchrum]|uniref:Uncharacterized protein n=1 Tax=Gongylonema pulchrum TaxID=637853 RepID=A0A183EJC1_9BILA|nr:unnamed protein product [Gongylonema pulchrum]